MVLPRIVKLFDFERPVWVMAGCEAAKRAPHSSGGQDCVRWAESVSNRFHWEDNLVSHQSPPPVERCLRCPEKHHDWVSTHTHALVIKILRN